MKKIKLAFIAVLLSTLGMNGTQAQVFEEGANNISIGYGLGTFVGALANSYENKSDYKFTSTGPLFFKFEHGISDKIGLGLNVGYVAYKFENGDSYFDSQNNPVVYKVTTKFSSISFLARMNIHFGDYDKFDPYWGVGLGYRTGNWSYESSDPNAPASTSFSAYFPFGFETTIGARYFFADAIAAYAEVGLAKAVFQIGLNVKF